PRGRYYWLRIFGDLDPSQVPTVQPPLTLKFARVGASEAPANAVLSNPEVLRNLTNDGEIAALGRLNLQLPDGREVSTERSTPYSHREPSPLAERSARAEDRVTWESTVSQTPGLFLGSATGNPPNSFNGQILLEGGDVTLTPTQDGLHYKIVGSGTQPT